MLSENDTVTLIHHAIPSSTIIVLHTSAVPLVHVIRTEAELTESPSSLMSTPPLALHSVFTLDTYHVPGADKDAG